MASGVTAFRAAESMLWTIENSRPDQQIISTHSELALLSEEFLLDLKLCVKLLDQDKSIQHFVVWWPSIFCISYSCPTVYVFLKQYVYIMLFRNDSTFTDTEMNQNIPELLNANARYFYCSVCQWRKIKYSK